jgi:formylglycine-generating enzyme required for sulfatase activity
MKKPKLTAFALGILFVSGCGGKTSDGEDTWEIVIVDGMATVPAGTYAEGTELEASVASFELDVTEVTVEAFQACVDAGACEPGRAATEDPDCNTGAAGREEHPINCVNGSQAVAYCAWVGKRLPTEGEWKFAAWYSDGRLYPWGDENPEDQLCWSGGSEGPRDSTCPVGSFPEDMSLFGPLDMAGNVNEFVSGTCGTEPCELFCGNAWWYIGRGGESQGCGTSGNITYGRRGNGFRCAR